MAADMTGMMLGKVGSRPYALNSKTFIDIMYRKALLNINVFCIEPPVLLKKNYIEK